ncbi:hypothetical protein C0993_007523, partial [Termitomyces sp. T159_Od127]
ALQSLLDLTAMSSFGFYMVFVACLAALFSVFALAAPAPELEKRDHSGKNHQRESQILVDADYIRALPFIRPNALSYPSSRFEAQAME